MLLLPKITSRACRGLIVLWVLILWVASPVLAGDEMKGRELRLGLLAHSTGPFSGGTETGADINAELLFEQNPELHFLFGRLAIGGSLSLAGDTSHIYAGRAWLLPLFKSFELEYQFGGSLHDGKLDTSDTDRRQLGTRVLFRNALELGYRWDRYRVSVMLAHLSNAGFFDKRNQGLDNVGLRLSINF